MELIIQMLLLFACEVSVILMLYRYILRDWIIDKWEDKIREEKGRWLLDVLDPVIEEIEVRTEEQIIAFQHSFFGSVGKMTSEAKKLDPMNDIRKAAKNNDWTSLIVEYLANKSGLGGVNALLKDKNNPKTSQKQEKLSQTLDKFNL